MRKRPLAIITAGILGGALLLASCNTEGSQDQAAPTMDSAHQGQGSNGSAGNEMEHPMDGGPAPAGIVAAESPKYPVGTEVTLTADHMSGMDGAKAVIAGAYDTYTYSVNYTPVNGGDPVKDHKWVVQEELKDAGDQRQADGARVTLDADHMAGMKGAEATIESSTDETVYMVDYEADGMTMTNHKWVVESEIEPAS